VDWSVAFRRLAGAVLAVGAATVLAAGGEADTGAGDGEEIGWKVRVLKAKTSAPSKATSKPAAAPKPPAAKTKPATPKTAVLSNGIGSAKGVAPWYRPVAFADLPGWAQDDHLVAFKVFLKSCERVVASGREQGPGDGKAPQWPPRALVAACGEARQVAGEIASKDKARAFFEARFTPNAVVKKGQTGLLTGYYEPLLEGSRTRHGKYQTPIYKRPPDLVNVVDDTRRGALKPGALTHVRKTATGTTPYYTRAEIEAGALKGKGLELLYFADPVDVFFMQIQGSGRVKLTDGTTVRLHYDGKNGHPYNSIGRYLTEKALFAADRMSMSALANWLRADPERGKLVMWQNTSYVFFREIKDETGAPLGAMRVALTPERSLAIDTAYHALGTPIYVSVPTMKHVPKASPFNRLMVAQDVGSAIRGPERGDIFFGSGDAAGKLAGSTKHNGRFFVLVPNGAPKETAAGAGAEKAQQ
jgi:membrane-bound lytic murein transglycosylase A